MKKANTLHLATATIGIIRQRAASEGKSMSQIVDEAVACSEVGRRLDRISEKIDRIERYVSTIDQDVKMVSED
jgi:hypothetical protein